MRVGGIGSSWLHTTGWEGLFSSMNAEVTGLGCLHLPHHLATDNMITCRRLCVARSIDWVPNSDCAQKVRNLWSKDTRLLHNPITVFEPLIDVMPDFADHQWNHNDIHCRLPRHRKPLCQYPKNVSVAELQTTKPQLLIKRFRAERHTLLLFVSHNLSTTKQPTRNIKNRPNR